MALGDGGFWERGGSGERDCCNAVASSSAAVLAGAPAAARKRPPWPISNSFLEAIFYFHTDLIRLYFGVYSRLYFGLYSRYNSLKRL